MWARTSLGPYGLRLIEWNTVSKTIISNTTIIVSGLVGGVVTGWAVIANDARVNDNNFARDSIEQPKASDKAWTNYYDRHK